MYSEKIMNEFYNPKNYGVIRGANGVGKVVCNIGNEIIKIYISVENNKIKDAQFQTYGGVVAIAITSIITSMMKDKNVDEIEKITVKDALKEIGEIPENKMYLVEAVVKAMHGSVENFKSKK